VNNIIHLNNCITHSISNELKFTVRKVFQNLIFKVMNIAELNLTQYQTIGELKQIFLLLTDSDLLLLENKQDEILKRLHNKPYKIDEEKYKCIAVA
jgi:hypothetical protein